MLSKTSIQVKIKPITVAMLSELCEVVVRFARPPYECRVRNMELRKGNLIHRDAMGLQGSIDEHDLSTLPPEQHVGFKSLPPRMQRLRLCAQKGRR